MIRWNTSVMVLLFAAAAGFTADLPAPTRLTLDPMAAPIPALKYRLLPEVRDQNPGNAAQLYLRSLNPEWLGHLQRDPKTYERMLQLSDKPLQEFTQKDVQDCSFILNSKMLKEVDRAARRPYCDWELTERIRVDGIAVLLPDVQSMRTLASLLRLRAKLELRQGKFDDAAVTLQTGLAMARHVGDGPTLIQGLVGVAIGSIMLQVVDEWISLPHAPNLYWALTDLPQPLVDMRRGFEGERLFIDSILPGYREMLADSSLPPPSSQELAKNLRNAVAITNDRAPNGFDRGVEAMLISLRNYSEAKRALREQGRSAEQIEAMPVLHSVFLFETLKYDTAYDENRKWLGVAYHEAVNSPQWSKERTSPRRSEFSHDLAENLLPGLSRVASAPARVGRKIAALRCVEAIRLYAVTSGGKLPVKPSDVTSAPIPDDPWTGKPFEYRCNGEKATLSGPPVGGEAPRAGNFIAYELTVRNKKAGE